MSNRVIILVNYFPSHKFGPGIQNHAERQRQRAFALAPRDLFPFNVTGAAFDPSGRINQGEGDAPEKNMLQAPWGFNVSYLDPCLP